MSSKSFSVSPGLPGSSPSSPLSSFFFFSFSSPSSFGSPLPWLSTSLSLQPSCQPSPCPSLSLFPSPCPPWL